MDGALDLDVLRNALGPSPNLPSAEELARLISDSELRLLGADRSVSPGLLELGWYLHGVASAWRAAELYPIERRRHAFAVSAHIFDLVLQTDDHDEADRLRLAFAAEVGFVRSSVDPNATAVRRRLGQHFYASYWDHPVPAVDAGSALLAVDVGWMYDRLRIFRDQLAREGLVWETPIDRTPFASSHLTLEAIWRTLLFLTRGDESRIHDADRLLRQAIVAEYSEGDIDSRWVAAHLVDLLPDIQRRSIWDGLPPDVPTGVRRAFAVAVPPVLFLWPPQLLAMDSSPVGTVVSPNVRRVVLSMPTSAGKTLLAQLIAVSHLATQESGVCIVAPTRALCREIERGMRARLRLMQRDSVIDLSDDTFATISLDRPADVVVMTPEALANAVRHDLGGFLESYGLIVFDEVHNVGDPSRGWTLESLISLVNTQTQETNHRMVLMSAALGNRIHFSNWVDPNRAGVDFHYDWRGPRRLTAIYTREADPFEVAVEVARPRRNSPRRLTRPLRGVLRVRTPDGRTVRLMFSEPVGSLVTRLKDGRWTTDDDSTPFYVSLAPLVALLASSGPVLAVAPTRPYAMDLARAISQEFEPSAKAEDLRILIQRRLGADHPLVELVKNGIAYHHGSLSRDVQVLIEQSLADGTLDVVTATTTLTEGVNLPVRAVVIAAQGGWAAGGYTEYITGPTLLNAIGRAGRAAKETEGWVVLARHAEYEEGDFERLEPSQDQLAAVSNLATEEGLAELEALEDAQRDGVDVVFENYGATVDSFSSFIWFLCGRDSDPAAFLERTLAWQQLDESGRQRWSALAQSVAGTFGRTEADQRMRWAGSGFSIASARRLDRIARDVSAALVETGVPETIRELLQAVLTAERLDGLMSLDEAPPSQARRHRSAPRDIKIPVLEMLLDWVAGMPIGEIADTHLSVVDNRRFRLEQAADFIATAFESYLPWSLGVAFDWALKLADGIESETISFAPVAIRYGVDSRQAARMLRQGLASRSLAVAVAGAHAVAGVEAGVREWLASVPVADWPTIFDASVPDIRDLLEFARPENARILADLLAGSEVVFPIDATIAEPIPRALERLELGGDPIPSVRVWVAGGLAGAIGSRQHTDIETIVRIGVPLSGQTEPSEQGTSLRLRVDFPAE